MSIGDLHVLYFCMAVHCTQGYMVINNAVLFSLFSPHSSSSHDMYLLLPFPPPSLPAHLDLSSSSMGDDLSLLPFCKEPSPPSEGEGLSLDHMSVSGGMGGGDEEE